MNIQDRTPGYIWLISMILAFPATWLLVGTSGEDVPGMVSMIVMLICLLVISSTLAWLRRRILRRKDIYPEPSD